VAGSCRSVIGEINNATSLAFSPDGQLIASISEDAVQVWEVATGLCRSRLGDNFVMINAITFLPDWSLVASASFDDTVVVWEVAMTGLLRRVLKSHDHGTKRIVTVAFSPDGRLFASGAINGEIQVWEVATGSYCRALKCDSD